MATKDRNVARKEAVASVKVDMAQETAAKAPKRDTHTLFVSAGEEIVRFDITVAGNRITPFWDEEREHLIWSVPADLVERFAAHEHVVKGRIVKAK